MDGVAPTSTSTNDILTLAGINATVLSILFAGVSAYLAIVWQRRYSLRLDLIDEANQLGEIELDRVMTGPDSQYDPSNADDRTELRKRLRDMLMDHWDGIWLGMPRERWFSKPPFDPRKHFDISPLPKRERFQCVVRAASMLVNSYPFRALPQNGSWPPGPLRFSKAEEVKSWQEDAHSMTGYLLPILRTHRAQFLQALAGYEGKGPRSYRGTSDFVVHVLESSLTTTSDVQQRVRRKLTQLSTLRIPRGGWIIAALLLATAAFGVGVLAPMFAEDMPRLWVVGVPTVLYVVAFVVSFALLARALRA